MLNLIIHADRTLILTAVAGVTRGCYTAPLLQVQHLIGDCVVFRSDTLEVGVEGWICSDKFNVFD